jgi:two-component system sensor histidine kinase/response regulator
MNKTHTILIVDDEPALRIGLSSIIKRHGYDVFTAENGSEGIKMAKEVKPDIILSDIMMPSLNGFEMRRAMSSDPQLSSIPFIFLTARTGATDRIAGIRDGADDYVTKPYVPDELLARIESVLRRVEIEQTHGREQMKEIAQRDMERLKQEILQNFHHELRTPLTNIIMPLELIVSNKFQDPEEQIQFIRMALANVGRMDSLVTDIILLSDIDNGNLNRIRQPIDIDTHIISPLRKRLERYNEKNIELVQEISMRHVIMAPRREFSHALLHLVDNAFKFSPQNGRIYLNVSTLEMGGAIITLRDEGPGIPTELHEKVFERFYQASHGDSRSHEGLGAGLTIARAVVSNLGGKVSIMDDGPGCTVVFEIPGVTSEDICYE